MDRIKRYRPSPAMIVAIIALVLSLGGTSYAAIVLPANSVGTKQIKRNAVTGAKVKNGSLTTSDIKASSLSKLGRVAVTFRSQMVASQVSSARIAVVTLKAPTKGFVLVNGWIWGSAANGRWGVRVWDDTAATHSPYVHYASPTGGDWTISNTAVFPVAAGSRNFSVRVENSSSGAFSASGTITAQFIPFNGVGTKVVP